MRVAVVCKSPLLQKSLELFLADHLGTLKHCDIVVCDDRNVTENRSIYISQTEDADLSKPFTAGQLFQALQRTLENDKTGALAEITDEMSVHDETPKEEKFQEEKPQEEKSKIDFSILEERIEQLTAQYQTDILRAIKLFYEK